MNSNAQSPTIEDFHLQPLLAAAQQHAGIFDPLDEDVREPLRRVLEAYRNEAGFEDRGIQAMHMHMVDLLAMRLRLRDAVNRHPQVNDEEIRAPLIILGLPRTGTTKLQRCLAATGCFQTLPLWKIMNPLPLPSDPPGTDSRIAVAEQIVGMLREAFPRLIAAHPMVATEPDEESLLLEQTFFNDAPCWLARVPSYQAWLLAHNNEPCYRWLKTVLQVLQWRDERAARQRPWVLKSPVHLGRLDEVFAVFPDAVIIQCHRDPVVSMPSAAALAAAMRSLYSDRVDAHEAGRFAMSLLSYGVRANLQQRARWEKAGKRFIDVPYRSIVGDMAGVAKRIFRAIDMSFDAQAKFALGAWEAANPRHKHGDFDYNLDDFGLSESEIRKTFADYIERFIGMRSQD
jgi:Sulfotransferase family